MRSPTARRALPCKTRCSTATPIWSTRTDQAIVAGVADPYETFQWGDGKNAWASLERIDYAMSSSPGGPWTYEGSLMPSGEYDG